MIRAIVRFFINLMDGVQEINEFKSTIWTINNIMRKEP